MAVRLVTYRSINTQCRVCGDSFTYTYSSGRPRTVCGAKCKARYSQICAAGPNSRYGPCSSDGCIGLATRISYGLCELHFTRMRRKGPLTRLRKPRRITSHGYEIEPPGDHPLSCKAFLYVHRAVAWEKHSGECPDCFWCKRPTTWQTCHIDHLNGVKSDNRPDNLEVACARCNRMRGSAWSFISSLDAEGFRIIAKLAGVEL